MKLEQSKRFYTIKEVSDQLRINPSLLRYWEKRFPTVRPRRTSTGIRQYTQKEIEEIHFIYYLVKEKGMTLFGVCKKLEMDRAKTVSIQKIFYRLKKVREILIKLKAEVDNIKLIFF